MRKIIFCGKTEDGDWIFGDLLSPDGVADGYYIMEDKPSIAKVIPDTVGQYTGLTDKNGKKIFEGDIVRFDYIGENMGVEGMATVIFQNGQFGVLWGWHKEFVPLTGFCNTTIEVIGNIYDNPELLRSGIE
nr:MAG TPA: YopX protein [Bacteriophage sp.]